ncbi:MAG: metallophosphoesterase, partial [Phaeodactylibacter sp.]|nr:metallophosphoesterase [Phaeodactylibacter sp.]
MQKLPLPHLALSALCYFQKAIKKYFPFIILCLALLPANNTQAHGSLHDVIERKSRQIEQNPDDALALFERGMLYQKHGETGLALSDFHRALQLEPGYHVCHLPLSELYLKSGRVRKALYHIGLLIEKEPNNPFAYQARAAVYQSLGWKARAVADLRRVVMLKNDDAIRPEDYFRLSDAILIGSPSDYDEAIGVLEAGLRRLGNIISIQSRILELELESNRCAAALERIDRIMAPLKRKEKWLAKKAQILERNGQPEEAFEAYRQARQEALVLNRQDFSEAKAPATGLNNPGNATAGPSPLPSGNAMLAVTRGPYLQMGSPTGMAARWRTDVATDSKIWYGPDPANLNMSAAVSGSQTDHVIILTGLAPNTRYYYAVGHDAGILAGGDANHFFQTSPNPGSTQTVRAWVLGDCGTGNSNARAVRNGYYNYIGNAHTDLILLLGDNAYDTGTDQQYQAALFQDMYEEKLIQSVLWPTIGNHDIDIGNSVNQLDPYFDIFTLPKNGEAGGLPSGTEAYYSFDYANVHFIILDSEYGPGRDPGSPMLVWLENDLQANTQDWTIVYWHHPPYSKGSHDSDSESSLREMRENVLPILEANGVDLVMSGHSHSYERSFLLEGHYGSSGTLQPSMIIDNGNGQANGDGPYQKIAAGPTPPDGAVYVVAGCSGKTSGGSLNHPAMYYSSSTLGSLSLEITGPQLDLRFVGTNGTVLDYFTMQKSTPVGNPPSVSVSAPPDGAYYSSPQLLSLQALATDSDGTIAEIVFLVNGATVGVDNTAPYSIDWQIPGSGNYSIQARARDNDDNYATSSPVNISAGSIQACSRVNSSSDDAEEKSSGSVGLTSSDLELVYDGSNQIVGMRFNNLDIPQGAIIANAFIQFTVDETRNNNPCVLNIYGQASDNAPGFSGSSNNISNRPATNAAIAWEPPTWASVGDAGPAQQTPDISPVIQEIVDRSGYTSGSSIVILINGTGRRTAESYNGSSANAPQLCLEYTTAPPSFDCPSLSANIGDACDDGDNTTIDDAVNANCICEGTATACTGIGDNDNDGVCLGVDCDDNDPNVTSTNTNDADCDGIPTAIDCDDTNAAIGSNANDMDCDG